MSQDYNGPYPVGAWESIDGSLWRTYKEAKENDDKRRKEADAHEPRPES